MIRRIVMLALSEIELDAELQQREDGLQAETVSEYAAVVDDLDPAVVFDDGEKKRLADGFHTFAANDKAGRKEMRCHIIDGDWLAAFEYSLGANSRHGLRRTNADKWKAIRNAHRVNAKLALNWSNREIARKCRVSDMTVAKVLAELKKEEKNGRGRGKLHKYAGGTNGQAADEDAPDLADPPDFARAREEADSILARIERESEEERPERLEDCREIVARATEDRARMLMVLGQWNSRLEKADRTLWKKTVRARKRTPVRTPE